MKKVLIITYYWPPSGGAGVQRWLKFAKYLPEFGFDVHVLTVRPDRATYPQTDDSLLDQVPENVTVHHTDSSDPYAIYSLFGKGAPSSGFANDHVSGFKGLIKKFARFVRGNFFIPDPRKGWNRFALQKAYELIDSLGIETVITTSPPHSTQLIGLELKNKKSIRWVADMRDPWTRIYYASELLQTKWAEKRNMQLERKVLENADKVITVSNALADEFCELASGLRRENVEVIPNGFDEDDFQFNVPLEKEFTIGYMGTITDQYDINSLLAAISSNRSNICFRFIGDVQSGLKSQFVQYSIDCEFTGYLDHDKAIRQVAACSILLLVIPKVKNNKGILTGKLFEYLALKRPILAIGPVDGDAAQILTETGAGKMFDYADENGIEDFLTQSISRAQIGPLGENVHVQRYTRRSLTSELAKYLSE